MIDCLHVNKAPQDAATLTKLPSNNVACSRDMGHPGCSVVIAGSPLDSQPPTICAEAVSRSIYAISPEGVVQSSPMRLIRNGGEPVRTFLPGWQPKFVYTGFAPINLLLFEHEQQGAAIWFLDETMDRRGGSFAELTPFTADRFIVAAAALFGEIWHDLVIGQRPPALTEASRSFFALPLTIRGHLLDAYLSQTDISTRYRSINSPSGLPNGGKLIDASGRRVLLEPSVMHQIFNPSLLQDAYVRLLQTGTFIWPSPIDGQDVQATHCFILGLNSFAYRLPDPRNNLTFYLIADEIWFRTACIYVPEAQLALTLDPGYAQALMPDLGRTMWQHVVEHGENLHGYLQEPAKQIHNVWRGITAMHLGHVLWQDISGIGRLVDTVPADRLPTFRLFDVEHGPEMYGPLDQIFPELQGRVVRDPGPFEAAIPTFYQDRLLAIKSSGMVVSRAVRERIMDAIRRDPIHTQQIAECDLAAASGQPIILLGLRTENRTLVDLKGFCERLIDFLAVRVGRAFVVVDGHNARQGNSGQVIWSHGELGATRSPIGVELEIVAALQRRVQGTQITIVSTIGNALADSLIWGSCCHVFVAQWGAGLAKYRWVCNKPGFVMTSNWNLHNRTDLHIYNTPEITEDPVPLEFIDPAIVTDRADAPLIVQLGAGLNPSIMNFDVNEPAVFQTIVALLRRFMPSLNTILPN